MKKYLVGFLTLVILVSSVYIMLPENVRIDVGNTYSTFKVWENGSWVTSGKEYTKLYDGTKLMRAKSRVVNYTIENNNTTIYRYAYFKDDIFAIDTYEFDGNVKDLELIPISHTIRILNAKDKIFHYEIRDILYNGETKNIVSPFSFGHNMQIEWESGNYYSKVFQQIVSDKIIIRYRPTSNDETYSVRLFDPITEEYQETADVITSDGSWSNVAYAYDTNWATSGFAAPGGASGSIYLNYTKPNGAINATWQVKGQSGEVNLTIGQLFFDIFDDYLKFKVTSVYDASNSYWYYCNSSDCSSTTLLYTDTSQQNVYEEAIWWNIDEPPLVTLNSPIDYFNTTNPSINFNCTVSDDGVVNVSLILDNQVNETNVTGISDFYYFEKNLAEGEHNWTCLVYDDLPQSTEPSVRFINVDYTNPLINIPYPENKSYITNVSDLNYTIIETNPSYCWYSKDLGVTNSSTQTCMDNWTDVFSIEGSNTWTIFVNDTAGNNNQTNVTFFKDSINPLIYFESETENNGTSHNKSFVYANVSVIEANEQNITYELYFINGTLINSSTYLTSIREKNWTGLDYGTYLYNVTIFDTLGHSNSTETRTIYLSDIFLFIDGNEETINVELNTTVNITGNSTLDFGLVCIDIDHPDYGYNYTCGNQSVSLNLTIDYFRKTSFWNDLTTRFFNFSFFQVDDVNLTIESHQYDDVSGLSVNVSSTDDVEDLVFYVCNTTNIDRAYQGFLVGDNIYLNQSINSAEDTFRNYENITFDNPGNASVYFYLDDNATIQNITMNVTGKNYGFSYFDEFDDFSNIDTLETTAQLHYGPGGFIQTPNSSLILNTLDTFGDASINGANWEYSASESGSWGSAGVRETGGYLEAYGSVNNGYYASISKFFYPYSNFTWYYTSDYLSFDLDSYSYELEDDSEENDCHESNRVLFGNVVVWQELDAPGGHDDSTNVADMGMEFIKINNSYWRLNISGTQVRTNGPFRTDCDDTGASVYTYDYSNGLYSVNYTDTDCTDTIVAFSNSSLVKVNEVYFIMEVYNGFKVDSSGYCYGNSHIRMDNLKNKMWNRDNGTVISNSIFDSSSNIVSATMNISGYNGINYGNYSFYPYMSADNGDHWESVSNGVEKTFDYPGTHVKWRVDFNTTNPGYQNITSYLENVTIITPVSFVSNLEFDFGNDGTWDYKLNGTFRDSNDTLTISMPNADISGAFTKRRKTTIGGENYDHTYQIPLRIYSATAGQINLDIFNITYNPNPVILNHTGIQDFIDTYGSNETNFTIPIGGTNGSVKVSDIRFDYAGGNDTINITFRNILSTITISKFLDFYYSSFNKILPYTWTENIFFLPRTNSSTGVSAYGQTTTKPLFNITTENYGKDMNLSIRLSESNTCLNIILSDNSTKSTGDNLSTSWTEISNNSGYLANNNFWAWADLYNCNASDQRILNPQFEFSSYCDDCFWSEI